MHREFIRTWTQKKTTAATDRLIVREIKSNQRLSAHKLKAEIEAEL